MPSERSRVLIVVVLIPIVVLAALLAAVTGLIGGPRALPALLFPVIGLVIPLVALYLLARVVGELERIADALEAREE